MSNRLELIEDKLKGINQATFQSLCDTYLFLREENVSSIQRTGSQFGKDKTIKGTPDSFMLLGDGSIRCIEHTTKETSLDKKLKGDIDSCLDQSKTGVIPSQISKIILCYNSRLKPSKVNDVFSYARGKRVQVELVDLDKLALEIFTNYQLLGKEFLGVSLDTGQLLPISKFIQQYGNKAKGLATPLDNVFLHRDSELETLQNTLKRDDILIISGYPGVGKTRLAIQTVSRLGEEFQDYKVFVVSNKSVDIYEDLRIQIKLKGNYLIIIDDANRQLMNLGQILGLLSETRQGKIKLILTVRDYALKDIDRACSEYNTTTFTLKKFTDDEIKFLLQSDSFNIQNGKYIRKIQDIADGNARLAIMAARLANQKQAEFLYNDVFELYDAYFKNFIQDTGLFDSPNLLKAIGLISFFYSINLNNREFLDSLLETFNLPYSNFIEASDQLGRLELVELQYGHVRISEQVMATYFFYKVFIQDGLLSFEALLNHYFETYKVRFTDTVIPATNSYGYDKVLTQIGATLDKYIDEHKSNPDQLFAFYSVFWAFKRERLLSQLASLVEDMPEPTEPEYSVKYEANDFVWDKDRVIEFVTYLLHHPTTEFPLALELGFEYCRKKPEALPEFVKVISERLVFDEEDEPSGFARQDQLFQVLFQGVAENKLHITEAFLDLSKKFLAHSFHITKGVRKHAITFYQYPHPMNDAVILNRKRIWECLFELFPKYQKHILDSIENYHQGTYGYIPEILGYDLDVIVPFLTTKLNKSDFYSVKAVRSFKRIIDNENLGRTDYVEAARKFKSTQYDIYRKLSWNRVHGKEDYEFDDYEEFRKLKEKDLLQSFTFLSCADADDLLRTVSIMSKLGGESEWHLSQSLEVLIVANLENDVEVGLQFLDLLLKQNIDWLRPMYRVLGSVGALQDEYVQRVWVSICQAYGVNQSVWKLEFLSFLKPNHCTIARAKNVIHTIRQLSVSCQIPVGRLSSYEKVNYYDLKSQILYWVSRIPLVGSLKIAKPKPFLVALLEIVSHKIAHDDIKLTLPYNFFDDFSESLSSHKELLFKLYIQQSLIYAHFDHHKRGFEYLYRMNPKFLVDFVRGLYSEKRQLGRNDRLEIPFIWNNPVRMDSISVTADHLVGTTHYFGIGEHSLCILFNDLNTEQQIIAKQFLRDYISANCNSVLHLNAIFDVVRNTMKDYFPDALSHFLTINQDLEVFKSVHWRRSGRVLSGDASFGQLQVNDWKQVLEVIDQHHLKTELLQIREYVLQGISQGHRYAEHEKQQKFVEPEW